MIVDTLPNGLRNLQVVGSLQAFQRRGIIIADQPGAGKTLQAEFAIEMDGQFLSPDARILITAPKTACQLMWARELEIRIASQYAVIIADLTGPCGSKRKGGASMAERERYLGSKMLEAHDARLPLIVLTNFEGIRWAYGKKPALPSLWQNRWSTILIDESHLVLPTTADDPKKYTQFWYGLEKLVTTPNALRIAMSGTPDNGRLQNRYGTYRFLHPNRFSSYWGWVKYFFVTSKNRWGGLDVYGLRTDRADAWNEFQHEIMVRRTKAEMLEGLPPKQWVNVPLPLHDEHRERYDTYEREQIEKIERLREEARSATEAEAKRLNAEAQGAEMSLATRSRQLSITDWFADQEGKWHAKGGPETSVVLEWIVEFLSERGHHPGDPDTSLGKVVITSYFVEVLVWLQDQLEAAGFGKIPVLSGQTPLHEKQRMEQEFQRGDSRILLFSGHIGVSISLDAADDMVFTDFVHDPDKVEQTEDRIHRASSKGVKQFWRLFGEDTMQETIVSVLDRRYSVTRKSYDGSRGVDFRRHILHAEQEVVA